MHALLLNIRKKNTFNSERQYILHNLVKKYINGMAFQFLCMTHWNICATSNQHYLNECIEHFTDD